MAVGRWGLLLVALALLAFLSIKNVMLDPPAPAPAMAGEFDQGRAIKRLATILGDQRPHPVDTAADDAVRERLMDELKAIGLTPRIQEATDCSDFPKSRVVSCSHVRNVIAVLPGPNAPALLLNAHYDSTPTGPGASDDGIGVATMLEVAAILKDRPRARPIIFLFNEGEEYGLNGAAAFAARDPLAKTIGKVINMESRGVSGPASMFETDTPNARAMSDYAAVTRHPFANSLTADLAKLIPNTTDVVKFKPAGWETLGFAIVGNETRYHSPGDRVEWLDRASLAHMGSEVLATADRLASPDHGAAAGQMAYADIAGRLFLHLPETAAVGGVAFLAVAALVLCWRRRGWMSVAAATGIAVAAVGVAVIADMAAGTIRDGDYWRAHAWAPYLAIYATTLVLLVAGVARASRRHERDQLRLAAWTLVTLLGLALTIALPGASIFFLIGPALALTGVAIERRSAAVATFLIIAGGLASLMMLAEVMAIFEMLLIDGPLYAVAPVAVLACLPLIVEAVPSAGRRQWAAFAAVAIIAWGASLFIDRASAVRPLAFTLDYVRDDIRGKSHWAIASKQAPLPDSMARFGPWKAGELPYNGRTRWIAAAPVLDLPNAQLARTTNVRVQGGRVATLKLATGEADAVILRFAKDVPVVSMGLPGQRHAIDTKATDGPFVLRCSGRQCDGLMVEVELATAKPVKAMLVAQAFGAPPEAAALLAAAPQPSHPQYAPHSSFRIRGYLL